MLKEKIKDRLFELSVALAAIFIPFFGYLLAYAYESGYCAKLGIPTVLIDIGINDVVKVSAILVVSFVFLLFIYDFIKTSGITKKRSLFIFFIFFHDALFVCFIAYAFDLSLWKAGILILLFFLGILMGYSRGEEEISRERDKIHINVGWIILLFLVFLTLSGAKGSIDAKVRKKFTIIKSNPNLVVLCKYSGKLVCAFFDREKKEIQNTYYLKSLDQIADEGLQLAIEKIGPLHVPKKENKVKQKKRD